MPITDLIQQAPAYVLVFFRVAGMMVFAPLFGSGRIPRRMKVMIAAVISMGMIATVNAPPALPESTWLLVAGLTGELLFGVAMGMVMSLIFIAVQWAGEIMGQQMGFNLSEVFDPQFGASGSLVGELYFMLTLVVFLIINGHHWLLRGVHASFDALPLLSIGVDVDLLSLMTGLLQSATVLALRLAAPMLVTMLIVDIALGFISKTMPQFNVMTAGLTIRALMGLIVMIVGVVLTGDVIGNALMQAMDVMYAGWTTPR